MSEEVKVPVSDLKIGMFVSRLDKDWSQSSFLLQGILIETEEDIKKFAQECSFVYVEDTAGTLRKEMELKIADEAHKKIQNEPVEKPQELKREHTNHLSDIVEGKVAIESIIPPKKTTSFSREMGVAKLSYKRCCMVLKNTMDDLKTGHAVIDVVLAEQAIHDCVSSMLRSPEAMLLTANLKEKHYSDWQHSMNVAILAINLGRYLNLADQELVTLGLCGMFHNIGNSLISKEDLEKTSDRKTLIRSHTKLGGDFLAKYSDKLSAEVAKVAYSHHENLDGSGFPLGLKEEEISAYSRIISITDLYHTLTTDTSKRKGLGHYEATGYLLKDVERGRLDKALVNSFNQCMGTYPVGCYVEMNTGEIAVVVGENAGHRLKPVVMLVTTPDKKERSKQIVNLAKPDADGNPSTYSIKGIVDSKQYALKL